MAKVPRDLFQSVIPFVEAARHGSFTQAATNLGISTSAVSKAIRQLEAELGAPLLVRTSRSVKLSPEGAAYFSRCEEAVLSLRTAREELSSSRKQPTGTLRITTSNVLGPLLVPRLSTFRARYPKLLVQLNLTERAVRLVDEEMDVALRIGVPKDSALVLRRLAEPRWALVCSPAYLAKRAKPKTSRDLGEFEAVQFVGANSTPRSLELLREPGGKPESLRIPPSLLLDNGHLLIDAALASLGVIQVFDFMLEEHLKRGTLVELFPELAPKGPPIVALFPRARAKSPAVSAFVEFLGGLFPKRS